MSAPAMSSAMARRIAVLSLGLLGASAQDDTNNTFTVSHLNSADSHSVFHCCFFFCAPAGALIFLDDSLGFVFVHGPRPRGVAQPPAGGAFVWLLQAQHRRGPAQEALP